LLLVRDGDTFLDIVAKQHRHLMSQTGIPLPLLFMNSFATDADTRADERERRNAGTNHFCGLYFHSETPLSLKGVER
jgi:UDP-N-acetylglucosamine pyrophosphorylase